MDKKLIIHTWLFRLLAPVFFGLFVYVLVLLFYDSINQLLTHFISYEYFVCLLLCLVNFELLRKLIQFCQHRFQANLLRQLSIQLALSLLLTVVLTGVLIYLYFKYLVGLTSFNSELVLFCSLLGLSTLFYNIIYAGQYMQNFIHLDSLSQQKQLKEEADTHWGDFQNKINPVFLYQSLEYLIGLAHTNTAQADDFVNQLSKIYRQVLSNTEDLVPLEEEIKFIKSFAEVLQTIFNHQVIIDLDASITQTLYITPTIIPLHIQQILNQNIANHLQKLHVSIQINDQAVCINYTANKRLALAPESLDINMHTENSKLEWYANKPVTISKNGTLTTVQLPLIKLNGS